MSLNEFYEQGMRLEPHFIDQEVRDIIKDQKLGPMTTRLMPDPDDPEGFLDVHGNSYTIKMGPLEEVWKHLLVRAVMEA